MFVVTIFYDSIFVGAVYVVSIFVGAICAGSVWSDAIFVDTIWLVTVEDWSGNWSEFDSCYLWGRFNEFVHIVNLLNVAKRRVYSTPSNNANLQGGAYFHILMNQDLSLSKWNFFNDFQVSFFFDGFAQLAFCLCAANDNFRPVHKKGLAFVKGLFE